MMSPWGIHLADGLIHPLWLISAGVLCLGLLWIGMLRMTANEIPIIALMTAAFFVASLIHVKIGGTSVHLMLNGVVGLILGARAPVAIILGLFLQAVLFGHGGITSLGVNALIMTVPAWLGGWSLRWLFRNGRLAKAATRWFMGACIGGGVVLLTLILYATVLLMGTLEEHDLSKLAYFVFVAHVPVGFIEALITATMLDFLYRVKPELLGRSVAFEAPVKVPQ